VSYAEVEYQISELHTCRLLGMGRSTYRYRARKPERDSALRARLKELAAKRMRFGYRRLTAMLVRENIFAQPTGPIACSLYCLASSVASLDQRKGICVR
jgi:hypothetical protein